VERSDRFLCLVPDMNRLYWYFKGYRTITISGVSIDRLLNNLMKNSIPFWNIEFLDSFTLKANFFIKDEFSLQKIAEASMCQVDFIESVGLKDALAGLFKRKMLLIALLMSICTVVTAQNFVLFYEVSGNVTVTDEEIIRALDALDIEIGTYGPSIKPKWIKDHVLGMIPQLQWITVTQNGSRAQVVVRERPLTPTTVQRCGYANIVASRPGLITEQSVVKGQALAHPGQVVNTGDLLVSGVVDLERVYSVVYAQAEIYARTWHDKDVIMPAEYQNKAYSGHRTVCMWMEIGKRRIKIFGNSRIYDTACDKMVSKITLTLPGELELPLSFLVETFVPYEVETSYVSSVCAQEMLEEYAYDRVCTELCAGSILRYSSELTNSDTFFRINADFECHEMIAKTVEGKWNEEDF